MMRGRIATFHRDQGFGFITPKVGVGDVFFHLSESSYRYPQAGDVVEYQQGPARDGGRIRAMRVRLVQSAGRGESED